MESILMRCQLCNTTLNNVYDYGIIVNESHDPFRVSANFLPSAKLKLCVECVNGVARISPAYENLNAKVRALKAAIEDITKS